MNAARLLISLFLLLLAWPAGAAGVFSVAGREIRLDGERFAVRGVCYQPARIGEDPSAGPPFGDYYTLGYQNRYVRDFQNLRMMGANVIRIYGWTIGADHSDFLAKAYNGGDRSLHVLINRYINPATDWSNPAAVNTLAADWQAIANELKDAPAVMGFLIGNEVNWQNNNGANPAFWSAMNQIAGAVKAVAPDKLVSVAITDALNQVAARDAAMTHLDFWALQVYRGASFHSLFSDYAARSGRPLVITEFGYDAYDARIGGEFADNAALPANALEALWNELRANAAVAAGACVFSYADEWWKSGSPWTHDAPPGWPGPFADGEANEEWWGIFRLVPGGGSLDILEPRALFYRLAAMWNPAFLVQLQPGLSGESLQVEFSYPLHLRDQRLEVQLSPDLAAWSKAADNFSSTYLMPVTPAVSITSTEAGDTLQVRIVHSGSAPGAPNLLVNGGFETGNLSGWLSSGAVSTTHAHAGNYSLRLTTAGNFSVPTAYQIVPAAPGDTFNLSGYLYTAAALPAGATFGLLKIVFKDAAGNDLVPAAVDIGQYGPPANPGAESLPFLDAASPVGAWVFTEAEAVAPPGTVSVSFFAINVDQAANTMYFDSLEAVAAGVPPADPSPRVFLRVRNLGR